MAVLPHTRPLYDDEDEEILDDLTLLISKNEGKLLSSSEVKVESFGNTRHKIHRRAIRLKRLFLGCICFVLLFLSVYVTIFATVQSRLLPLAGWGYNTSRNTADYVFPNLYTTLIEPKDLCTNKFFLLIVVCSAVNNFAARQNIRETWGNTSEFNYPMFYQLHSSMKGQYLDIRMKSLHEFSGYMNAHQISSDESNPLEQVHDQNIPIKVVFLIGRSEYESHMGNETLFRIKQESEQYNDLVQEDFLDTYNNLTIKSVMMLKWITQKKCSDQFKFLMKCDDDTFVNVPNLLHFLLGGTIPIYNSTIPYFDRRTVKVKSESNRLKQYEGLLLGHMFCSVKPVANVSSKWYTPYYMFSGNVYPKYLSGASYLMSHDVVPKLYGAALNSSLLQLEDVYITGICAEFINLRRHHNPLFSFEHSKNNCSYKGTITQHYVKGDLMRDAYNFVSNIQVFCPSPDLKFKTKRLREQLSSCT